MKNKIDSITETELYINELTERANHPDTMRPLNPLEREHLKDWEAHFLPRLQAEKEKEVV